MIDLGTLYMKIEAKTDKAVAGLKKFKKQLKDAWSEGTKFQKITKTMKVAFVALTAVIVAGWKAIKNYSDKVGEFMDSMAKNAKRANMTTEEYSKVAFQMERTGASMATVDKLSRKLLGTEFQGNLQGALDYLMSIEDESERIAKAEEMFGKRLAHEIIPYLKQTKEEQNELVKDAEKFSQMTEQAGKNAEAYEDALTNWKYASQIVQVIWAEKILPVMTDIINSLANWIADHQDQIEKFLGGVADALAWILDHIDQILPMVALLGTILAGIKIAKIVKTVGTLISKLSLVGQVIEAIGVLGAGAFAGIIVAVLAVGAIIALVAKNWDTIVAQLKADWEAWGAIFKGVVESLKQAWQNLVAKLKKGVNAVVNSGPVQTAVNVVKKLIDWWDKLKKKLSKAITATVNTTGNAGKGTVGHRIGLQEVPFDNYPAMLHRGEAILTATEVNQYKSILNGLENNNTRQQPQAQTVILNVDGREIARATAPMMDERIKTIVKQKNRKLGVV